MAHCSKESTTRVPACLNDQHRRSRINLQPWVTHDTGANDWFRRSVVQPFWMRHLLTSGEKRVQLQPGSDNPNGVTGCRWKLNRSVIHAVVVISRCGFWNITIYGHHHEAELGPIERWPPPHSPCSWAWTQSWPPAQTHRRPGRTCLSSCPAVL